VVLHLCHVPVLSLASLWLVFMAVAAGRTCSSTVCVCAHIGAGRCADRQLCAGQLLGQSAERITSDGISVPHRGQRSDGWGTGLAGRIPGAFWQACFTP